MTEIRRYAVVVDGVVDNVVLWDGATPWSPGLGQAVPCPEDVGSGWQHLGADRFEPPPPVEEP